RLRFSRIEIGDTAGTDFNRDFDMATRGELAPLWLSHGVLSEVLMDCDDLASLIAAALGQLLARPGISANNLVFHGAGGVLTSFDQKPSIGVPQPARLPVADTSAGHHA
ncbi:MAG: hypothetical protein HOV66_06540, partial [Streptomycetaceae bacterium]|nr:hypothetical protein [Streptomycetaceae bacterium]